MQSAELKQSRESAGYSSTTHQTSKPSPKQENPEPHAEKGTLQEDGGSTSQPEGTFKSLDVEGCPWVRFEVTLPGVESIAEANLEISTTQISFSGVGGFAFKLD